MPVAQMREDRLAHVSLAYDAAGNRDLFGILDVPPCRCFKFRKPGERRITAPPDPLNDRRHSPFERTVRVVVLGQHALKRAPIRAVDDSQALKTFLALAPGPHPRRVLTLMPRLGFAHPRLGMAAGAAPPAFPTPAAFPPRFV